MMLLDPCSILITQASYTRTIMKQGCKVVFEFIIEYDKKSRYVLYIYAPIQCYYLLPFEV